jgi:predicted GNAT family N-acyltransferase
MHQREQSYHVREAFWSQDGGILYALRREVFVEEQGVPAEIELDGLDEEALHIVALDEGGEGVGCGRLLRSGKLGRMAVLSGWRGFGVGRALLDGLMEMAKKEGIERLFLSAQIRAVGFYERAGFVTEGGIYEEAGIPHQRMFYAEKGHESIDALR